MPKVLLLLSLLLLTPFKPLPSVLAADYENRTAPIELQNTLTSTTQKKRESKTGEDNVNKVTFVTKAFPELSTTLLREAVNAWQEWKETGREDFLEAALFNVDSALSIDPDESEAWFLQGLFYGEMQNSQLAQERAVSSLIQCVDLEPEHGPCQLMLAQKLQGLGQFELAAAQYRFVMDKDPTMVNGMTLMGFAVSLVGADKAQVGVDFLEPLLEQSPDNGPARTTLAVLYKAQGKMVEAKAQLERITSEHLGSKAIQAHAQSLLQKWQKEAS